MVKKASPVRAVAVGPQRWIHGNQFAKKLGYKQPAIAVTKHVSIQDRAKLSSLCAVGGQLNTPLRNATLDINNKQARYISNEGAKSLVAHSRLPDSITVAKELGVDVCGVKISFREMETISMVQKVFDGEDMHLQFPVGRYRIDLYFPKHKLALECDEAGHAGRDQQAECDRQNFITHQLGCKWVRFNPDSASFCMGKVLNAIYQSLKGNSQ